MDMGCFTNARCCVSTTTARSTPGSSRARSTGTESVVPPSRYLCPSSSTICETSGREADALRYSVFAGSSSICTYAGWPNTTSLTTAHMRVAEALNVS